MQAQRRLLMDLDSRLPRQITDMPQEENACDLPAPTVLGGYMVLEQMDAEVQEVR